MKQNYWILLALEAQKGCKRICKNRLSLTQKFKLIKPRKIFIHIKKIHQKSNKDLEVTHSQFKILSSKKPTQKLKKYIPQFRQFSKCKTNTQKNIQLMHTNSIQTEYYDQTDQIPVSNFYHHSAHESSLRKQVSPGSSNVLLRIQENIREYQLEIRKNKDVINQLQCQRKFFEKLSQKQKEKIDQVDVEKIRLHYEGRISNVKKQVTEMHQVIATYHEEEQMAGDSFVETYQKITNNKEFLMQTLIQLERENQLRAVEVDEEERLVNGLGQEILRNQQVLKEKEAVHRKYVQLQIQIERLQRKMHSPNKKT